MLSSDRVSRYRKCMTKPQTWRAHGVLGVGWLLVFAGCQTEKSVDRASSGGGPGQTTEATSEEPDGGASGGSTEDPASSGGAHAEGTGGRADQTGTGGDGEDASSWARAGCKRGLAYGYHSLADLTVLSPGVSWWYNWDFRPDEELRAGAYQDLDVEYVPMIWGEGSDLEAAARGIPADATTLLGFNEPNFGSQADLSATAAAALWPELEELADDFDLRLVSPAVNFCGGDCQDTDPFNYLHEFLDACEGCRVDALAIHIYVGCSPSGDNKAEWLINHIETYKTEFEQPLWLTEFACDSASSEAEQQAFLEDAVEYLENEPRIERYAWFAGRADNVAHVDLLGADGQLTALGTAYVNAPQPKECER